MNMTQSLHTASMISELERQLEWVKKKQKQHRDAGDLDKSRGMDRSAGHECARSGSYWMMAEHLRQRIRYLRGKG